jgi:hypothetical protein
MKDVEFMGISVFVDSLLGVLSLPLLSPSPQVVPKFVRACVIDVIVIVVKFENFDRI